VSRDARSELLDQLLVERWDVLGLPARNETVVDHDFLVDAVRAGIP
jgi:hypothetical protein